MTPAYVEGVFQYNCVVQGRILGYICVCVCGVRACVHDCMSVYVCVCVMNYIDSDELVIWVLE